MEKELYDYIMENTGNKKVYKFTMEHMESGVQKTIILGDPTGSDSQIEIINAFESRKMLNITMCFVGCANSTSGSQRFISKNIFKNNNHDYDYRTILDKIDRVDLDNSDYFSNIELKAHNYGDAIISLDAIYNNELTDMIGIIEIIVTI